MAGKAKEEMKWCKSPPADKDSPVGGGTVGACQCVPVITLFLAEPAFEVEASEISSLASSFRSGCLTGHCCLLASFPSVFFFCFVGWLSVFSFRSYLLRLH